MTVRTLFLLANVAFVWTSTNNHTLISSDLSGIADILQELCPGANICNEYRTYEAPQKSFIPGFKSCCTDCSCGPNCEVDGNCCFPNVKHTREKMHVKTFQPETICIFPSTIQPAGKNLVQFYKMISYIPKPVENQLNSTTNVSCGEENVAPWGNLYPVYSEERKSIYKNLACAEADDVTDGILWDARLHCLDTLDDDISEDVTSFVIGLNSRFDHERCSVDFIYKGDYQDIRSLICYVDLRDNCQADDFEVPDVVNVSHQEIKKACKSGLVSPYRKTFDMFANVFCFICNGDTLSQSCLKTDDPNSRGDSLHGFISLIDKNFISDTRRNYIKNPKVSPQACTVPPASNRLKVKDCRMVFCPSGQLRDSNGQCRYPNNLWLGQEYMVPIALTAKEKIDVSQVFQVKPGHVTNKLPNFTHPWQNNWLIRSVSYEDTGDNRNITSFRIMLSIKITKVRPDLLFNRIKNRINRNWMLTHNNVTTILKSRISKYKSIIRVGESSSRIGNHSNIISQPLFIRVYSQFGLPRNEFVISKLFWCEQIELTRPDFILSLDMRVLFNRMTTRFMYNGEFVLIKVDSNEDITARICIEDSGMYLSDRLAASNGSMFYKIHCVWLSIIIVYVVSG